jgi:hypothetical protein
MIDAKLICSSSDYFKKAMEGGWKEAQERKFYLDDDPEIFQVYCTWLYTKTIATVDTTSDTADEAVDRSVEHSTLARAYVFGEKRQDMAFKNALINAFIHTCHII